MIYLDGLAAGKEEGFRVRLALASSGDYEPPKLFPSWFDKTADDASEEPIDDADTDFDYSGVKWELPSDGDKKAMEQLSQVMAKNASVSVNGDDESDPLARLMDFTPADREWV